MSTFVTMDDLIEEMKIREREYKMKSKKTDAPQISKTEAPRREVSNVGANVVHRIVAGNLTSRWFTYQQIATLMTPTGLLHAATDYFHGSLPTNCVFTIQEIV